MNTVIFGSKPKTMSYEEFKAEVYRINGKKYEPENAPDNETSLPPF